MANSVTLLSSIIPKSFWASRLNKSTSKFDKIEFSKPADITQLAIDDNFFVKADSQGQMQIPSEFATALKTHLEQLGAELVPFDTENSNIFRCWIAPKK